MRKSVYLMDVDGVIVTGRPSDGAAWWTDLEQHFGFDKSALRTHFFAPFWQDIVRGRDQLLPRLAEALIAMQSPASPEAVRDFWFSQDARIDRKVCAWMDRRRAAGHRVMLATNQDHSRAAHLLDNLGLRDHCDGAYTSAAIGFAKPDAAFFDGIAKAEDRQVTDLILIDDTMENVEAAKRCGWQAYHYTGQPLDQIMRQSSWSAHHKDQPDLQPR